MLPPQTAASSYQWGQLFDLTRRQGAASVYVSPQDQLLMTQEISALAYRYALWPFTFETTPLGSIQCQNLVQDYAQPDDLYLLSRAWFYVPTLNTGSNTGTLPPYADPSAQAQVAAQLSASYVGGISSGSPVACIWPTSGSLDVLKRLPMNLYPRAFTGIRAITQQPNQKVVRLDWATMVPSSQPYSLELEYQPVRPPVSAMTEYCWFPDAYMSIATEGILYKLYRFNNDPRAGTASYSQGGAVSYSGQLAVWMGSMESAAAAERSGAVDQLSPSDSIGSGYSNSGGYWFA